MLRLIEVFTGLALLFAIIVSFLGGNQIGVAVEADPLTGAFLSLIGGVAILLWSSAWMWEANDDKSESGAGFQEALDRIQARAAPLMLMVDDLQRLPYGLSEQLVDDELEDPHAHNLPHWLVLGQGILVSLGLIGTFFGLTYGLLTAAPMLAGTPEDMQVGMSALLDGAKLAFAKSLAGVWVSMIWAAKYQQLELRQRNQLHKLVKVVDERYPPIYPAAWAVERNDAALRDIVSAITAQHDQVAVKIDLQTQTMADVIKHQGRSITGSVAESATALNQRLDQLHHLVAAKIDEVINGIRVLEESLPEALGQRTSDLLAPSFDKLALTLRELSQAGGQAISDNLQSSVETEVGALQEALAALSRQLNSIAPSITQHVHQAETRVQQGADNAASRLEAAGEATSVNLEAASASLASHAADLQQAMAKAQQVAELLRDFSTPLVQLPDALSGASRSLALVGPAIDAATTSLSEERQSLDASMISRREVNAAQQRLADETRALASSLEVLRAASAGTIAELGETSAEQRASFEGAIEQVNRTVQSFTIGLGVAQESVAESSRSALAQTQELTNEAVRTLIGTLEHSANRLDGAMEQQARLSNEVATAMSAAGQISERLTEQAGSLYAGIETIRQPFSEINAAFSSVPSAVQGASELLKQQHANLLVLQGGWKSQADQLGLAEAAMVTRIGEYQRLNENLERTWVQHVSGTGSLLAHVQKSWEDAINASKQGVENNAVQLAEYARQVEKALSLPTDLSDLNQTITELNDVLDELKTTLKGDS